MHDLGKGAKDATIGDHVGRGHERHDEETRGIHVGRRQGLGNIHEGGNSTRLYFKLQNSKKHFFPQISIFLKTFFFMLKCDMPIRKYLQCSVNFKFLTFSFSQGGAPVWFHKIHLVHCPWLFEVLYGVAKPFLNDKTRGNVVLHKKASDGTWPTLYQEVQESSHGTENESRNIEKAKVFSNPQFIMADKIT